MQIKVDNFIIHHNDSGVVEYIDFPAIENKPVEVMADCINAFAKEIVTMRKLLVDIGDSMYAEYPVEALHDAVDKAREYIEQLPKNNASMVRNDV